MGEASSWLAVKGTSGPTAEVLPAQAGRLDEGLPIARERTADLIVLDVMMPGVDGLQVLERLRAADAHLPIVLLTAIDAAADQVRGLGLSSDDYIVKPFTFEVLAARRRAHLRRSAAEHVPVLRFEDLALDRGTRLAHRGEREVELTTTEYGLLQLGSGGEARLIHTVRGAGYVLGRE